MGGRKAVLVLQDGTVVQGKGFGASAISQGELVFNTSMMGYEEALTDPSYAGQLLLMTYPLLGNYGISGKIRESDRIQPSAFVIRELSEDYEHRDAKSSLDAFLKEQGVPGICGIDTRFVVRHIRDKGVMPALLAVSDEGEKEIETKKLIERAGGFDYSSMDFVSKVTTKKTLVFGAGGKSGDGSERNGRKKRVALIDFGVKMGIVRELVAKGAEVHVLPSFSSAEDVKALEPDGILLSNGPGNPALLTDAHRAIRSLGGYKPMFGICLGHQLLAHAFGGDTYKLKFGHRGSNHAVLDMLRNRVSITTQNHGFAVGKMPGGFELTHINVNDRTVEGMRNEARHILSVQYHPEAAPGPRDSRYLFDEFMKMI